MSVIGIRRTPICSLGPTSTDFLLVAVIIAKRSPRTITIKKDNQSRAVWNFTIRDSPADYINVSAWGSPDFIYKVASQFHVGDVVDIIKASISQKRGGESDVFLPSVTNSLHIVMNENKTEICLHDNDDCTDFFSLLRLPTKPPDDFVSLTDIHRNSSALKGQYVNLLVAVRSIEPMRTIRTKSGSELRCREVAVMDQTHVGLTLIMWDEEDICRVASWSPRDTILFLADVHLEWNTFRKEMSATVTSRSVITENPNIEEAMVLRSYARTAPTKPVAILNHLANNIVDVSSINSVMSCQTVWDKAVSGDTSDSFTALVYAHIHHLDLDGVTPVTLIKCSHCTVQVDENIGICLNSDCPTSTGADIASTEKIFDLRITLADHTGCLPMCRLTPLAARNILDYTENEFDQLTLDEKTTLKWKYLLKRCSAKLVVLPASRERLSPLISVAGLSKVSLTEYAARLPMY